MSRAAQALRAVPDVEVNPEVTPASARHDASTASRASVEPLPGLVAAVVEGLDEDRRVATLRLGRDAVDATLDRAVDAAVVKTALTRGERVIAQRESEGWVLLGALRTAPTPGVDEGEEFQLKAKRISVQAEHEFSVVSGAASLVVRALGQVETLAESITARASSVHKIIGRVIRLN